MRRTRNLYCALALLSVSTAALGASLHVRLSGAVAHAGTITLDGHPRLSDAALAAQPLPSAYLLGAAWLRPSLRRHQLRLKAGVLFDLTSLQQRARRQDHPALAALAGSLHDWIAPMPVRGRELALLDPRVVEVDASANLPLRDGDRLYYPWRPRSIRVVGAVRHPCTLPLVPLQDARRYLAACPSSAQADLDTIYVIEPDGRVFVQGIALWNRGAARFLAPGAVIYVPLRPRSIAPIDPGLNHDLAAFLATQLLPGPGVD